MAQPKFKIVTTKRNWFEKAKDKQTAYISEETIKRYIEEQKNK